MFLISSLPLFSCPKEAEKKSHASNGRNAAPSCRHFDGRSRVKKSHSPQGMQQAGDLSTQRLNSPEVFIPIPPCSSARDDGGGRQHTVISKRQLTETPPRTLVISSVISTEVGQPPIGKPLIVQARGQLRLTWKLYAESPQSEEISLSHGMPQAGDLSAQRFNGPRVFTSYTGTFPRSR